MDANTARNPSVSAARPSRIRGGAHQQISPLCFRVKIDEREDGRPCLVSAGAGTVVWAGVWECQSQQQEAQQGAQGLLGRMQAKGIVGNYTGLERASNALIQRDIFIKKRGCWTGTTRASGREAAADPRLLRIRHLRRHFLLFVWLSARLSCAPRRIVHFPYSQQKNCIR